MLPFPGNTNFLPLILPHLAIGRNLIKRTRYFITHPPLLSPPPPMPPQDYICDCFVFPPHFHLYNPFSSVLFFFSSLLFFQRSGSACLISLEALPRKDASRGQEVATQSARLIRDIHFFLPSPFGLLAPFSSPSSLPFLYLHPSLPPHPFLLFTLPFTLLSLSSPSLSLSSPSLSLSSPSLSLSSPSLSLSSPSLSLSSPSLPSFFIFTLPAVCVFPPLSRKIFIV
ncbi:unnamed protein product [Acanthosepion pharaonis]|uniref:Uncharacterized protein n=1 Tax=Acanthosepion pharaonis TaxID=158019 RepID=A0A812BG04_ACAPH|nr:unnamed protein product [Sepia pharaonis]